VNVWLPGALPDITGAEAALQWLLARWNEERPDILVFPADAAGHELAVRMSARLGCLCFPEARELRREGHGVTGRKKVCGSNLDWAWTADVPLIVTVSPGGANFLEQGAETERSVEIPVSSGFPAWLLNREKLETRQANPLETAPLIFAAGRGLGSAAACKRLGRIAARYDAPLGFSRPAALNGWGDISCIIGQSGIRCRAAVCVALGVSGAAAFMAGIEGVRRLVAVNPDKNAPIFQYADIGIIATAEEWMAAMEACAEAES
jgi:electron transfer flavoprotein alpha subunit